MDHYDEKMNYSFEPVAPETPQPPLEQAKEEIRRSGKHTGLKIAALLAAVAIVAGVGGSALTTTARCWRESQDCPRRFPRRSWTFYCKTAWRFWKCGLAGQS